MSKFPSGQGTIPTKNPVKKNLKSKLIGADEAGNFVKWF